MKKILSLFTLLLTFLPGFGQGEKQEGLYVGTFTSEGAEGIYYCRFNSTTGSLTLVQTFKATDNPSFLKISPDRNYLYAVTRPAKAIEPSGGFIQAYRIMQNGSLQFLNKQVSNGDDPCHVDISADGKYAAIATYGGGTVSLYPLESNGNVLPATATIVNEGSGPNPSRQKGPHAHAVKFHPDGKHLMSTDLGTDRLNIHQIDKKRLKPASQSFAALAPGAGPRHLSIHPRGNVIYVINELNSTITAFEKKGRKWTELQTISTVPEGFDGTNYCADIHLSADGRYLYGSNRGHNSIAVFKRDSGTGRLEWVTSVSTEGDWPRNFTFSPDNRFMLVANQRSGNIAIFKMNENGIPQYTGNELKIPAPVCLEFR